MLPREPLRSGSFDPFCGLMVAEWEERELVDLMRDSPPATVCPAPAFPPRGAPEVTFGVRLPRWDQLSPRGFYARVMQPALTVALMLATAPLVLGLMLPIALVNWLAIGDYRLIFFTQQRVGQYGRIFRIFKFRTMRPAPGVDFEAWSRGDQNRVTPLGRFLRSTHLDELPQFLNVLLGDMEFIGPRPEMVAIHNWACQEVPGFERRLALRPGITGLAQITQGYTGKCVEAYAEKLRADEDYRDRFCLWLDIEILARTVVWMLRGRGWRWNAG